MAAGRFMEAGDGYFALGDKEGAARAYEAALAIPAGGFEEARIEARQRELVDRITWLSEQLGGYHRAAEFARRAGLWSEAVDLYRKAKALPEAALMLEQAGDLLGASRLYDETGDHRRSMSCQARSFLGKGESVAAGDVFAQIGAVGEAAEAYQAAFKAGKLSAAEVQDRVAVLAEAKAGSAASASPAPAGKRPRKAAGGRKGLRRRTASMIAEEPLPQGRRGPVAASKGRRGVAPRRAPRPAAPRSPLEAARSAERAGQLAKAGELYIVARAFKEARRCHLATENWRGVAESFSAEQRPYEAGIVCFALGDIDGAVMNLDRVSDEHSNALDARRVTAILLALIGDEEAACAAFDTCFGESISIDDIEPFYYYGQVLEQRQETQAQALAIFQTVVELDPEFRDAKARVAALQRGIASPQTSIYDDAHQEEQSLFHILQAEVFQAL